MSPLRVRKAVIPAAGLGTRFLPATKAAPKEMLTLVDKPAIQYVVEEAVNAGLDDILVITGRGKRTLEDHFDRSLELEQQLEAGGKTELAAEIRAIAELAQVHYVRQGEARGLGHAVSVARRHVGDEPFAVLLPDDIMLESYGVLRGMIAAHQEHGASLVATIEVSDEEITALGAADFDPVDDTLVRLNGVVEKPPLGEAPSNLALIGRYVFTPAIFDALDRTEPGRGGEIQLTDAIGLLLKEQPVYGYRFSGGRFDIGNKPGFLEATVELALDRADLGPAFGRYLAEVVRREQLG